MCHQATKRLLDEQLSIEDDQFRAGRNEVVAAVELKEFDVDQIFVELVVCKGPFQRQELVLVERRLIGGLRMQRNEFTCERAVERKRKREG